MKAIILPNFDAESDVDIFKFQPMDSALEYVIIDPPKTNVNATGYVKMQHGKLWSMLAAGQVDPETDAVFQDGGKFSGELAKTFKNYRFLTFTKSDTTVFHVLHNRRTIMLPIPNLQTKIEEKENLILYDGRKDNYQYWDMLRGNFPQYEFLDVSEIKRLSNLIPYFRRAKLLINFSNLKSSDCHLRWAIAMACNCYVLEPYKSNPYLGFKCVYPVELVYISPAKQKKSKWAKPKLRVKLNLKLMDTVYAVMENFNWYHPYTHYILNLEQIFAPLNHFKQYVYTKQPVAR